MNKFIVTITSLFFLLLFANHQGNADIEPTIAEDQLSFERKAKEMNKQLDRMKQVTLTVTAYSPTINETDSTPLVTAFQKPVKYGIIGISRDLEELYGWKEGDNILLEGVGIFEVGDRMHHRWKKRVDIFYWHTQDAKNFGTIRTVGYKIGA